MGVIQIDLNGTDPNGSQWDWSNWISMGLIQMDLNGTDPIWSQWDWSK
jgi:hypothetical protein